MRFYGFDLRLVPGPVIPNTLKMGVVPACMVLMMKWGPRNMTGWPGVSIMSVSEIKHAPCTWCAHFQGRVHDFQRCAPELCTIFQPFVITTY